jgi:hypothetical protein
MLSTIINFIIPRHKINYDNSFCVLTKYIKKKYETNVIYSSKEDYLYDPWTNTIYLNNRSPKRVQLYFFLHEVGHIVSSQKCNGEHYRRSYPLLKDIMRDDAKRYNKNVRVEILREEIEAWDLGLHLAKKLKILLDEEDFYKTYRKSIYSYVKWAI